MPPKHKHISWDNLYMDNITAWFPDHPERFELKVGMLDEESTKAQLAVYEAMKETEENEEMSKRLYFDILVRRDAFNIPDISRLKNLWPAYQNNIHVVTDVTGFNFNVKVEARVLEKGQQITGVSRGVTCNEIILAGSFDDAVDFVMEELLNRINKTQDTQFTRGVSCIYKYLAKDYLPKKHDDAVDSLGYAYECWDRNRSRYKTGRKQHIDIPELKRVHSSGPVSVAIWSNGKKSMVRKQKGDKSDPEKGILYAVIKGLCYEKGGTKEYSRILDMIHEALEERKNG